MLNAIPLAEQIEIGSSQYSLGALPAGYRVDAELGLVALANAGTWWDHQCAYMDIFTDDDTAHFFLPHRWRRCPPPAPGRIGADGIIDASGDGVSLVDGNSAGMRARRTIQHKGTKKQSYTKYN